MMIDGNHWFVAKDVAEILGYSETSKMLRRIKPNSIKKIKSSVLEPLTNRYGNNDIVLIDEPGLYVAILGSKKSEAEAFQDWIKEQVPLSIEFRS